MSTIQSIPSPGDDQMHPLISGLSALEILRAPLTESEASRSQCCDIEGTSISAIYQIPAELVCEIFTLTLPHIRHVAGRPLEQPPWRLGHICQQWRAMVLANPLFWSTITLYAPRTGWRGQSCPPLMVETQLLRSGAAPLHIILESRESDIFDSCSSDSIDLLIGQSLRWETAHLRLHHGLAPRLANHLRKVKGKFPMLRTLELISSPNFGEIIGDIFSIAPSLSAVFLDDYNNASPFSFPPKTHFPLSEITRFRGSYQNSEDCVDIFQAAPNLIECGMSSISTQLSDGIHILLAQLFRLSVAGDILAFITAPSLQELWVSGNATRSLLAFIRRSGPSCHLRKLVVDQCSDPAALIPILRAIPTLRTFFVVFASRTTSADQRALFNALKIVRSSANICPNLTHVAAGGPLEFPVHDFVDMVASRWYTVDPPRIVSFMRVFYRVPMAGRMPTKAVAQIDKMRSEGLDAALDTSLHPSRENYLGIDRP
ncbi:hypothetical protein B0H12DRAFT_1103110 [Mycena haematopus]|nr:hypothetical protein B0H12DRAFT_1103110 [Mycena haematopus]